MLFQLGRIESERAHSRNEMLRKFPRPMAGHDLLHDLLLYKSPRPIAHGAFFGSEEFFYRVVIQRGHVVRQLSDRAT